MEALTSPLIIALVAELVSFDLCNAITGMKVDDLPGGPPVVTGPLWIAPSSVVSVTQVKDKNCSAIVTTHKTAYVMGKPCEVNCKLNGGTDCVQD